MQLCRAFLWEGKAYLTMAPLVSWDWVCRPKKSGGLGIRDYKLWNMAAIGKYTWQIAQKEDTLWIKWVHCIYIKNENWWTYVAPSSASWSWKVICKMKDKMKVLITIISGWMAAEITLLRKATIGSGEIKTL